MRNRELFCAEQRELFASTERTIAHCALPTGPRFWGPLRPLQAQSASPTSNPGRGSKLGGGRGGPPRADSGGSLGPLTMSGVDVKPPLRRACVIRCLPGAPHRQRVMSPRVCGAEKRGQHWRWRHRRERDALVKDTSDALSQRRLKGPELTLRSF